MRAPRKAPPRGALRRAWPPVVAALLAAAAAEAPLPPPVPAGLDPMVSAAISEARRRVDEAPAEASRWLELGRLFHAHELTAPAAACYREAVRRGPQVARAWYSLALAEADLGELPAALDHLERAARLAPGYAPAAWRRGRWLLELGRLDEAEEAFRRAVEIDAGQSAGWVGLARVALERGAAVEAIPLLQRVLASDPANGVAGQLLGSAYRALGDEAAARRALALATGMGAYFPDPWQEEILGSATGVGNRLRLLSARLERGETDAVLAELEALAEEHPEDVGVLNKLSEAHLRRGEPDRALEVLETALAVDPGEFATRIHVAQALRRRGDLDRALEWAERAIDANPTFWQGHFERAGILHRAGRLGECLDSLTEAMRRGAHQNPNAWLMQGDAQLRLAAWDAAARTFEAAARRFPFVAQAFVGLAMAEVERGRPDAARRAVEEAAILQPGDPAVAELRRRIAALEAAPDPAPEDDGG